MQDHIHLTDLPKVLRADGVKATYNQIYRRALQGDFPAERIGGRWYVRAGDVPQVAAAFAPVPAK